MLEDFLQAYNRQRLNRLAEKMQKGDVRAAEEIYSYFMNKVFGFLISRLRNKAAAEDLTQDIFLKLVNKISLFNPKLGSFSTWFWQLVRNTLIDYYRSSENKNIKFSEIEETKVEQTLIADSDNLESRFELNRMYEFLKTLSPEEQEIFGMRFVSQLSFREMSELLEKSEGALRVNIMRLKRKIKDNFKNE